MKKNKLPAAAGAAALALALALSGCGWNWLEFDPDAPIEVSPPWEGAGTRGTGIAPGFGGPFTVIVTLEGGRIVDIETQHSETQSFYDSIMPAAKRMAIAANRFAGAGFDTMAGATVTRNAFILAGTRALNDAGANAPLP
jgi:hypothetical protein